jgi:hypothetical protein
VLAIGQLYLRSQYGYQRAVEFAQNQFGLYRLHILESGSGVVSQFSRHRQKGPPIHDQLHGGALFLQARDAGNCLPVTLDRNQRRAS